MTADFSSGNVSRDGSPDWDAIARFLAGESTSAEAGAVRAWMNANPPERDLLERLDAAITVPSNPVDVDVDVDAALARVHERITTMPKLTVERGHARRNRFLFVVGVGAAAAAAGAVFVVRGTPRTQPQGRTYVTSVGQRDSVLLGDGSRVVLGPRSTLVVPVDFATRRAVRLIGDAYFDVRHDVSKPFSVRVRDAVVEDIGTAFSVESDVVNETSVAVVSGSVRLRADSALSASGVVLQAGDRGDIDARGRTRVERGVVRSDDVAWTSGRLVFRDAPLSRVAAELQRWYGVTLRADDSILYQRHVSTTLAGDSIDQVAKILELSLGARVERHGDTLTIHATRGAAGSR